jgi:hypothetical protein
MVTSLDQQSDQVPEIERSPIIGKPKHAKKTYKLLDMGAARM